MLSKMVEAYDNVNANESNTTQLAASPINKERIVLSIQQLCITFAPCSEGHNVQMQHGSSLVRSSLYHPFMLLCCDFAVSPLESGQIAEKQRRNNEEASKDDRRKNPKVIKAAPTKRLKAYENKKRKRKTR